jgi:hypothetical protein
MSQEVSWASQADSVSKPSPKCLRALRVHTLVTWHPSPLVFASRTAARQEALDMLRQAAKFVSSA